MLLIVLIGTTAFFVAAEMALVRIRHTRVEHLAAEGSKTAQVILRWLEADNQQRYIAACQLGITIATLALGATGEASFSDDLVRFVEGLGILPAAAQPIAKATIFAAAFSVFAFLQTMFGELLPKTLTLPRAEAVLFILIWPMQLWCGLTSPFLTLLNKFQTMILKLWRIPEPPRHSSVPSGEELRILVSASQVEGAIEEKEEEMIHCVFDFSDTVANEVMTPRTDMVCVSADCAVKEFVSLALQHGYSRIPVFEKDMDSIFGAVHIRDGLRALMEHKELSKVREFARKVLIVPETKPAADLLTDFKKTKTHVAIVVDEYGTTVGLVTIEDLIEELVGDIADEHEIVEEYVNEQDDGSVLLDAKLPLDELKDRLGISLEDDEFNTLGGYVFGQLGREPQVGDEVSGYGYVFRVEEADRHRITKLRFIKQVPETNGQVVENNGVESEEPPAKGPRKTAELERRAT